MNKEDNEAMSSAVKALFDHLRNLFICTSLAAAATSIPYFHEYMPLNYGVAFVFGVLLLVTSICLIVINLVPLVKRIDPIFKAGSILRRLIIVSGFAIYLNVALALVVATQRVFI